MSECVQPLIESGYLDLSSSREALYHFLVVYTFSTLWTQCKEPYELPACHIEKMSQEAPQNYLKCILHYADNWNTDCDWRTLWSQLLSWNTKQCDSVDLLLAFHTTRPRYKGSWFLVTWCLSFAGEAQWLELFHCPNIELQHFHSAHNTETPPF